MQADLRFDEILEIADEDFRTVKRNDGSTVTKVKALDEGGAPGFRLSATPSELRDNRWLLRTAGQQGARPRFGSNADPARTRAGVAHDEDAQHLDIKYDFSPSPRDLC
jgi:hypothetical protein